MSITRHVRSTGLRAARAARATGVARLARWHVRTHEGARRNAMIASTELVQRRFEREEVEEFLVRHRERYDAVG